MLIGLAIGDALGATYEFGSSKTITSFKENVREMHATHRFPKGVWTDDASMALCLADSLIECGGYSSFDVMDKYIMWLYEGYRSYFPMGVGLGLQTGHMIRRYQNEDPVIEKTEKRSIFAGNGTIMRLAPVIIAAHKTTTIKDTIKLAQISARETHYSTEAEAGTEVFAAMLYKTLEGETKEEIMDVKKYSTGKDYDDILTKISDNNDKEKLKDLGGYIIDALRIALWAFRGTDNFEDGMVEIICLGGDTDTNAAVYGQLAGAYYGYEAIPEQWIKNVYLGGEIIEVSDKLLAMKKCPIIETRFEEDEVMGYFDPR